MQALLALHITAGTLSVLTGPATLLFRKGERTHRTAGSVFVVSMAIMAVTAAVLGNVGGGGLTIYMIATAWMAARRSDHEVGLFEIAAFGIATAGAIAMSIALMAPGPGEPENPFIVPMSVFLNGVVILAALGDLSVVVRRGISGGQRIARHLWRMCFGLFIAVGSFAAQGAEALPPAVPRAELLLASMTLVLLAMAYWSVRVLFTNWYGSRGDRA